jgi:tetratricopeptide (TPR) repeat protein
MNDSSPPGSRRPASSSSGAPGKPAAGHGAGKIAGNVAIIVADLVGQGRDAVERGDIKAARRALDGATSRAPKDRDVMVLKALVRAADGDAEEALEVLDVAIDRFPDDVALVAHKAFILLDDIGDPEEALPLLQECLAILGGGGHDDDAGLDTELRLRLIDANLALGDVEAAIEAGRNAVAGAANADDVSTQAFARSSLARALMAAGDLPGARAEADLAVAGCPDNADVHAVLGRVAITAGDDEAAARAFARAVALDPDQGQPPRLSAKAFKARFEGAVADLPHPLRGYVQGLPWQFVEHADVSRLDAMQRSPETPLLLDGPLREPGSGDPFRHRPTAAVVYQRSLETLCRADDELEDMIIAVVVEGVGMFLGLEFDEDLENYAEVDDSDD